MKSIKLTNNIVIVGAGYVGLSLAILCAKNHHVTIVDKIPEKVKKINHHISPVDDVDFERALSNLTLNLTATTDDVTAYRAATIVIIAVSTDYDCERGSFNTVNVENVVSRVSAINPSATIVIKSTVPIGFTRKMRGYTGNQNIIFSPEFLRESRALYDCSHPSRIIVGTDIKDARTMELSRGFVSLILESVVKKDNFIRYIGFNEAEAVKLFSNAYLALRVAYFNELDTYAEMNGLDARSIIDGVCLDQRIGEYYNNPSFGYGGYCLPKDTKQLISNFGCIPQKVIGAIAESNRIRKEFIAKRIYEMAKAYKNNNLKDNAKEYITVGVYRLTMNGAVRNFRQSAILDVMTHINSMGAKIIIYEPILNFKTFYHGYEVVKCLKRFKTMSDFIIANRYDKELNDVMYKVYTRDLFYRD